VEYCGQGREEEGGEEKRKRESGSGLTRLLQVWREGERKGGREGGREEGKIFVDTYTNCNVPNLIS